MRHLKIAHTTTYEYSNPVELQPHKLLLRPREGHDIRIESSRLDIVPAHEIKWQRDVYGNSVAMVSFLEPTARLSIDSEILIEHYEEAPLDFLVAEYAVNFPFHYEALESIDLKPAQTPLFLQHRPLLRNWLARFQTPGQRLETYVLLDRLNKAIAQEFTYQMREAPGVQSPAETLAKRSGSCRDLATLFIEACRYFGLAVRFVSGYLYSPAPQPNAGATHAWSEVYLPGAGWKGFDSTGGQVTGRDHIAVAVNRRPEAVPPVSGAYLSNIVQPPTMTVNVQVSEV